MVEEWRRGEYLITTDPARMDLDMIHGYLSTCYWAAGIPREMVARSIAHSLPFGLFAGERQIGFARVITDRATFAYIGDVFVLEEFRHRGLAHWLMRVVVEHPELQGLRRWSLATRDAHALYRSVGFTPLSAPERWMQRHDPDVYQRGSQPSEP
jgi:GNAT superfamily N-acetyltransferase